MFIKCNGKKVELELINLPKFNAITTCPTCNGELVRDGAYLTCPNIDCGGKTYGDLMTWIQVHQIKGFGPVVLRALIDLGIDDVVKLYKADVSDFVKATNSESLGVKIRNNLHAKKSIRLGRFLTGLNIPTLGDTNGTRLETEFKTLGAIYELEEEELANRIGQIDGIATNASKIASGLLQNRDFVVELSWIVNVVDLADAGPLAGNSFCITGELSIPRNTAHELIQTAGGIVKTSVGKGLTYLVTNDPNSGSSKNKKAQAIGTKIITEKQLMEMVK